MKLTTMTANLRVISYIANTNPTCLYLRQARKTPRSLRPRNCRTSGFDTAAFIPNGAQPTFEWSGLHASDD